MIGHAAWLTTTTAGNLALVFRQAPGHQHQPRTALSQLLRSSVTHGATSKSWCRSPPTRQPVVTSKECCRERRESDCNILRRRCFLRGQKYIQSQARQLLAMPRHERKAIRRRIGRAGCAGLLESARPDATEVRRPLACWTMARQNREVGRTPRPVCSTVGSRRVLPRYITWAMVQKRSLSRMQVVSRLAWRTLGCVQIEVGTRLGGRRLNQGSGRCGE